MELAALQQESRKAREFQHEIGECRFTLRTPTRLEIRQCMHRHGLDPSGAGGVMMSLLQQYLLDDHLVAWTGVRELHIVGDSSAPLPWSADLVRLLMDSQPEWADELGAKLLASVATRGARLGADAKN